MTTQFDVPARKDTLAGGIDSLESIPGLLKRLQIRAQATLAVGIDFWGLFKRLQIRAQATLAIGIDSWAP